MLKEQIIKPENLVGKRYGKLTVIEKAENAPNGHARWICKCDCGKMKEKPVLGYDLDPHETITLSQ